MLILVFLLILHELVNSSAGLSTWLELLAAILKAIPIISWNYKFFVISFVGVLYLFFRTKNDMRF